MDANLKKKWVEALRSGNYRQGYGALRKRGLSPDELYYCCLGVLCDIIEPNKWIAHPILYEYYTYFYKDSRSEATLPPSLQEDMCINPMQTDHLMLMNDNMEKSFDEIADWIESNL